MPVYVNGTAVGTSFSQDQSDATATSKDIIKGKTAYVNNKRIKGTFIDGLQRICTVTKSLSYVFADYQATDIDEIVRQLDTSEVTNWYSAFSGASSAVDLSGLDLSSATTLASTFQNCVSLRKLPLAKVSSVTYLGSTFLGATSLAAVPEIDGSRVSGMDNAYYKCSSLKTIPEANLKLAQGNVNCFRAFSECVNLEDLSAFDAQTSNCGLLCDNCVSLKSFGTIDLRTYTSGSYNVEKMFSRCYNLERVKPRNIPSSLSFGDCPHLTNDIVVGIANELIVPTSTSQNLTLHTITANKLDNIFVKLIDITDEMRAEDDFIDKKLPCEVCGAEDEGAMSLREYILSKKWTIRS